MTSTPASRNALATTLAPRSCPSSPGLAMMTRILLIRAPSQADHQHCTPRLELFDRGVAQEQVLDAVLLAEVDLSFRVIASALDREHPAEAVAVVVDQVAWRQGRHGAVASGHHARAPGQPLGR